MRFELLLLYFKNRGIEILLFLDEPTKHLNTAHKDKVFVLE